MLEEIKRTLEVGDDSLDEQIGDFVNRISKQLRVRLGFVDEVPAVLDYIIVEATVKRFNRKGDEGMSSYSQEGESISYGSILDEYTEDIEAWKMKQAEEKSTLPRRGVARFL